jgi:hypothetical protein
MDIIKPVTVSNSVLTSSNVTEDDYSEWSSSTTYADGANVIVVGTTHKVYESLVNSNLNNDPTTDDGTNWLELGATNRWKAFDQKIADQVSNTDTIEYQFNDPNSNITSLSMFGLSGTSCNVTVTDGDLVNTTYTVTVASGTQYDGVTTGNVFVFGSDSRPTVTFRRGNTYIFNQADSSNVGHQIAIRETDGTAWTSGVTTTGTLGTDSVTTFVVPNDAPDDLQYYCVAHGISMGNDITIEGDGEVFNQDFSLLDNSDIVDFFTYFFAEQGTKTEALFTGIPPYLDSSVEVTITADSGEDAKVGQIVFGFLSNFGLTTYGTSVGIEDYSRKETDAFGNFVITERAFAKLVDYDVRLETGKARTVQNTLANFRATPIVYIGSEDEAFATIVYGFYRRFDITLEGPAYSFAALEVEGLT